MIPPTGKQQFQLCTCIFTGILLLGNCYQVQCTTGTTASPGGSSYSPNYYSLACLRMLLLLSGDVELNPGPITSGKHVHT